MTGTRVARRLAWGAVIIGAAAGVALLPTGSAAATSPLSVSLSGPSSAVLTGQTVSLTADVTGAGSGDALDYRWDLDGSGAFATDTGGADNVSHVYSQEGSVQVAARVTDTTSAETATASTVVQVTPTAASLIVQPDPVLTGQTVLLNASDSDLTNSPALDYRWAPDGDGVFRVDTGRVPELVRTYSSPGNVNVSVSVTRPGGRVDTVTQVVDVRPAPPAPVPGVVINDGATYTDNPHVNLATVWIPYATVMQISNDSLFAFPLQVPVGPGVPWDLTVDPSHPVRTVYVRYLGTPFEIVHGAGPLYTDIVTASITLDQFPPAVQTAVITARDAGTKKAPTVAYRLAVQASDQQSGIAGMQLARDRAQPAPATGFSPSLAVAPPLPLYVRVTDGAGNLSAWYPITQPVVSKPKVKAKARRCYARKRIRGKVRRVRVRCAKRKPHKPSRRR